MLVALFSDLNAVLGSTGDQECSEQGKQTWLGQFAQQFARAGYATRAKKLCQLKRSAQLVVTTLAEGALLWYLADAKVCLLYSSGRMEQPRQRCCGNTQPNTPQAAGSLRTLHWSEMAVNRCRRCDQVHDLLSLVVELREQVDRLSTIRESEKKIDGWDPALASPKQEMPPVKTQDQESLVSFTPPD